MTERRFWLALSGNWVGELMIRAPQLVLDLLVIQMLSTSQLGVWVGVKAAMQFASALSGVPLSGLDIEYSYAIGRANAGEARRSAGAAVYAVLFLTIATVALLLPGVFSGGFRSTVIQGSSDGEFIAFLIFALLQGAYNFFITHLRNQLRFAQVNGVICLGSLLTVAAVYWLAPQIGVSGIILGYALAYAFCCLIWLRWVELSWPSSREAWSLIRALCATGAALAAITLSVSALRLIARWFIGQQFGEIPLGQYGVAATAAGVVLLAGGATSRVVMQFAARAFGAEMPADQQAIRFALLPGIAIAGGGVMASIAVAALAEWLIPLWLPQHAGAVVLLRPVLYASSILGVGMVLTSALRAQSRQRPLIMACLAASAIQLSLMVAATLANWPLYTFACLETISFTCFLTFLLAITPCSGRQRLAFGLAVLAAILLGVVAMELSRSVVAPTTLLGAAGNIMLASAMFLPWFAVGGPLFRSLLSGLPASLAPSPLEAESAKPNHSASTPHPRAA